MAKSAATVAINEKDSSRFLTKIPPETGRAYATRWSNRCAKHFADLIGLIPYVTAAFNLNELNVTVEGSCRCGFGYFPDEYSDRPTSSSMTLAGVVLPNEQNLLTIACNLLSEIVRLPFIAAISGSERLE